MTPTNPARMLRLLVIAVALAIGPMLPPAGAQTVSGRNPTAAAVKEGQVLDEFGQIRGVISIPDSKASMLEQPQGRGYRGFHEGALPWIGGIAILGMLALLAAFYLVWGRVRTHSPSSGVTILRFDVLERFVHWVTAASFVVLAITGLNYVFGKRLLMPVIGAEAFAGWSHWAKYAHDFISWPFILGVFFMLVMWVRDNIPARYDWAWVKAGGGFLDRSGHTQPPAGRFNAGQKLIYWAVILSWIALTVTGLLLLFPFSLAGVNGMQVAQYVHGVAGMLLIAVILAHIYIGTLGMEGAFTAMHTGKVDLAWAKEHHPIWVEQQQARTGGGQPQLPPRPTPAE